jgi:hypothetical protein
MLSFRSSWLLSLMSGVKNDKDIATDIVSEIFSPEWDG